MDDDAEAETIPRPHRADRNEATAGASLARASD
jgi:hypothetical protein